MIRLIPYVLLLIGFSTNAQSGKPAGAFQYQLQTKTATIDCNLVYNGLESVFVMYAKSFDRPTDTTKVSQDESNRTIIRPNIGDGKDFVLYKHYETGMMVSRELIVNGQKAVVNDSIPRLNWKLEPEKKQIGPYSCQKATTTFRCARYTAWFTATIPLPIGPWKLSGLPGLIVEATNEDMGLTYKLSRAKYPIVLGNEYPIELPKTGDPVYTFAQFGDLQVRELKKMETYLKSMSGNPASGQFYARLPECYDKQ